MDMHTCTCIVRTFSSSDGIHSRVQTVQHLHLFAHTHKYKHIHRCIESDNATLHAHISLVNNYMHTGIHTHSDMKHKTTLGSYRNTSASHSQIIQIFLSRSRAWYLSSSVLHGTSNYSLMCLCFWCFLCRHRVFFRSYFHPFEPPARLSYDTGQKLRRHNASQRTPAQRMVPQNRHKFSHLLWRTYAQVRKIAPEYYDNLPQCKSWPGIIFKYIFDDSMGPYARVKRREDAPKQDWDPRC